MVPPIVQVLGHLRSHLLEPTKICGAFLDELTIAVVAPFHLTHDMWWNHLTMFFVEILDVVDIVHVHDEPPHLLGDFRFSVFDVVDNFSHHSLDRLHISGDVLEVGCGLFGHRGFFFLMPVPVSALLNSFATLPGMPTFLAKVGEWAAAVIVRAYLGDLLGIWCS